MSWNDSIMKAKGGRVMKDRYYWLEKLAYKMILYHHKKFEKWCDIHTNWLNKWKEKHDAEVE